MNDVVARREVALTPVDAFFAASEARNDRWRALESAANAWASSNEKPAHSRATQLVQELAPIEDYWSYPGPKLMQAVKDGLAGQDRAGFARLVKKVGRSLLSNSYRYDASAWDDGDDSAYQSGSALPPDAGAQGAPKPSFDVLVVTTNDTAHWEEARQQIERLRRREDPFTYHVVMVGSFEDAAVATVLNHTIQAVVIYDGFGFPSQNDAPLLQDHLSRYAKLDSDVVKSGQPLGTRLAALIKNFRPELDIYLITDRSVEALAGTEEVSAIRRIFFGIEEALEIHLSIMDGVSDRYRTPYFSNLVHYSQRPIGTFHALPVARGKSVFHSSWIRDMGEFYGTNIFLAESSATTGGLDSLLEPTGNIKATQELAARAFGADRVYLSTNGTSTSNKIVVQALCAPGDIIIVDRNCHKSHHYGFVLSGAQPIYVEAFPLTKYSMYGAVPLRTIKLALLTLKAEGKLDRVKLVDLTNCTFDGHMYNTQRLMEECLAIKPDLIFLWDEAWFGFARFSPLHRRRSAMGAARALATRYRSPAYRAEFEAQAAKLKGWAPDDPKLLELHLLPDPDKVRIRVYQTNSTHKSMSAFRQGSMILVCDEDFADVEGTFQEAFLTHTSTSPNLQLIASLDVARRQMEFEGYELTMRMTGLSVELRTRVNSHPLISKYFRIASVADMIPEEFRQSGLTDYGPPHSSWRDVVKAWDEDECALDPTRITLLCGDAGFDGSQFKALLAERFDIQINKTSRNSVLVQININNTRGDIAHLIKALVDLSRDIDQRLAREGASAGEVLKARVRSLTVDVPDLPNFSSFHDSFRDDPRSGTSEGHMREAFFRAYDEGNCDYVKLNSPQMDERLKNGPPLISANFVIPYPPGFPIMVPGQVITSETITFMRKLDVKEIHGYQAARGVKVLKPERLSAAGTKTRH
jgi:arginine decarboxylase